MKKIKKPNFKIDEVVLVLIVVAVAVGVSFYDRQNKPGSIGPENITDILMDGHSVSFVSGGVVDESRLTEVRKMSYEELKSYLNLKKDFCIYLEDGNGNIILSKEPERQDNSLMCKSR